MGEVAHPCHVNLIRVVQPFSHTAKVEQCHACVKPLRKMAIILLTGQWYAPSAVISDAWYCMVLHGIAWYCIVLHGIAWYCMILHGIAWFCMVLHGFVWYYMVLHGIAWYCIVLHSIKWYCMVLHGIACYCIHGIA